MKRTKQSAFTLVELLVVLAIIAVLAGISFAGYVSFVKKAYLSNDKALLNQLNTVLLAAAAKDGSNKTAHDALLDCAAAGFDVNDFATQSDCFFLWDSVNDIFVYAENDSPPDVSDFVSYEHYFKICNSHTKFADEQTYSVYLGDGALDNYTNSPSAVKDNTIIVSKGIDAGNYKYLNICYKNKIAKQDVIIRTCSAFTMLQIDAFVSPNGSDTILHYGAAGELDVICLAEQSLHTYGSVISANLRQGRVVVEQSGALQYAKVYDGYVQNYGTCTTFVFDQSKTQTDEAASEQTGAKKCDGNIVFVGQTSDFFENQSQKALTAAQNAELSTAQADDDVPNTETTDDDSQNDGNTKDTDAKTEENSDGEQDETDVHTHVFDRQIATSDTLKEAATCTSAAKYRFSCECGEVDIDPNADTFCFGEALGHAYGEPTTTRTPTCTEKGLLKRVCTRSGCEAFETEVIDATGHTEATDRAVEETCTQSGLSEGSHCEVCNEILTKQTEIAALGHVWDDGDTAHKFTCTVCGETEQREHTFSEWVSANAETHRRSCSCGTVEEEKHNYENNACSVCGCTAEAWQLVTDASLLEENDQVIIAASDCDLAMSSTSAATYRCTAQITKSDNCIADKESLVQIFTVKQGNGDGTWALFDGSEYLCCNSNGALTSSSTLSAYGSWSICVSTDGIASVYTQAGRYTYYIAYTNSSFAVSRNTQNISLYKLTTSSYTKTDDDADNDDATAETDTEEATATLDTISLPDTVTADFDLSESAAWTVKSGADFVRISNGKAVVTRDSDDQTVVLTATVTVGSVSVSKDFEVTISKAETTSVCEVVSINVLSYTSQTLCTVTVSGVSNYRNSRLQFKNGSMTISAADGYAFSSVTIQADSGTYIVTANGADYTISTSGTISLSEGIVQITIVGTGYVESIQLDVVES